MPLLHQLAKLLGMQLLLLFLHLELLLVGLQGFSKRGRCSRCCCRSWGLLLRRRGCRGCGRCR